MDRQNYDSQDHTLIDARTVKMIQNENNTAAENQKKIQKHLIDFSAL